LPRFVAHDTKVVADDSATRDVTHAMGRATALLCAVCFVVCWHNAFGSLLAPWVGVVSVADDATPQDLHRTHSSLVNQTLLAHELQWTLVDCGSNSNMALDTMAQLDTNPHVVVVRPELPLSPAECVGRGLAAVSAEFVSVLAVGDMYTPPGLETLAWSLFSRKDTVVASSCVVRRAGSRQEPACFRMHGSCPHMPMGSLARRALMQQLCPVVKLDTIETWWSRCSAMLYHRKGTGHTVPLPLLVTSRPPPLIPALKVSSHRRSATLAPPVEIRPIERIVWQLPRLVVPPMPPKRRVVLVLLPWLYVGGTEVVVRNLMQRLQADGWTIVLACAMHAGPNSAKFIPQMQKITQDIHVLSVYLPVRDHAPFLLHLIRTRGVTVVLASNCMLFYKSVAHLRSRAPRVTFVDLLHTVSPDWLDGGFPRLSVDHHASIDYTLAISHGSLDWVIEHQPLIESRSDVMYPGVVIPATIPPFAKRKAVVYVGRMDRLKRPQVVVKAFLSAIDLLGPQTVGTRAKPRPATTLQMVGDGVMRSSAERVALKAGALAKLPTDPGMVYFHGSLNRSGVVQCLHQSRLYVLASVTEGMPLAASEAMAHGLAIIIGNVGQIKELVGDAAFRVINMTQDEDRDVELFTNATRSFFQLSEEEQQSWGDRARARMEAMYNQTTTLGRVVPLFNGFSARRDPVPARGNLARALSSYVRHNGGSLLDSTVRRQSKWHTARNCSRGMVTRVVSPRIRSQVTPTKAPPVVEPPPIESSAWPSSLWVAIVFFVGVLTLLQCRRHRCCVARKANAHVQ